MSNTALPPHPLQADLDAAAATVNANPDKVTVAQRDEFLRLLADIVANPSDVQSAQQFIASARLLVPTAAPSSALAPAPVPTAQPAQTPAPAAVQTPSSGTPTQQAPVTAPIPVVRPATPAPQAPPAPTQASQPQPAQSPAPQAPVAPPAPTSSQPSAPAGGATIDDVLRAVNGFGSTQRQHTTDIHNLRTDVDNLQAQMTTLQQGQGSAPDSRQMVSPPRRKGFFGRLFEAETR